MKERIEYAQVYKLQPVLAKSLITLGDTAAAGLDKLLVHLVKLRVSQINGCAFCQHMHANEARKDGELQERLDLLAAWSEVPVFSARERAALHWAEAVTKLDHGDLLEKTYTELLVYFSEIEVVNLMSIIVTINAWNRVAVGFHFLPKLTSA